jgi:hypothetical protein
VKIIIALFLVLAPLSVHAQLLKCVGKDGKIEYAAQCPTGTKEQQTGIKNTKEGPTTSGKSTAQKSLAERDADFRKRQTDQQAAATKKAEESKDAEARKANCENARSHLTALEAGERVVKVDPTSGERSYLDDNERKKAVAQARASVDGWCK